MLCEAGLLDAFEHHHVACHGDLDLPVGDPARGPTSLVNELALLAMTRALNERVGTAVTAGRLPIVYGGDCSTLLGIVYVPFLGGYALDDIARTTAWRYGTWIAIAYIISRGIAKAGSQRAYQPEPFADRNGDGFWRDDDRDAERRARRDELDLRDERRTEPAEVVGQSGEPTPAYDTNGR